MKILVVTNMYPTPDAPAAGIFVREHVDALVARGVDVEVLAVHGRHGRASYVTSIPDLARRLRRERFDLVHAQHSYCTLQVVLAGGLSRRRPPLLVTLHEGESFLPPGVRDPGADVLRRLVYSKRIKRFAIGVADHVVTVAPGIVEALSSNVRHTVIPPGVDVARFRPMERGACRKRLGLSAAPPIVFFPASPKRDFNKGYSVFNRAVDGLSRPVQVVTGGAIHPRDMPAYMNAADAVVQASLFEASPMVVKEAMACDRPLVSTDVGDVGELVAGVRGCFICSPDPEDMAAKVEAALALDGAPSSGRARILERDLSVGAVADRYLALYERIVATSGDRR
jgi:glycosyltransferase involved in cell wall biosynthesis